MLKELLKDRYKVALYKVYEKEVELNENVQLEEDAIIILFISSIKKEQYIKGNVLSIIVPAYINTTFSVK